ncbi:MAG: fatty acid hydroxylase family protein [Bacteroidetes bacterium]|nr:MAG: fatty acid hydroxylase family protein [Bacteroidota bacterium]
MAFFDHVVNIYTGYAKYLWGTISDPFRYDNYFYYLIYVSLAVWILELMLPWRKNQAMFRKDFWLDAFWMFFNFFIFNLIIYIALSSVTEEYFGKMMQAIGLPKKGLIDLSGLSLWIQFPIYFILADFVQWSVHVMLHRVPWLWKFHKVHHSVREMGFAAHLRYHFMETFVYKTALYIFMAWLLNFKLEYAFFMHAFTILVGHLNHANVGWDYGPLKYILNNPKMHIWHHAKHMPSTHPYGINFGITLSIWDYLFKTDHIPHSGRDIELGFEGIESYPEGFFELQIKPFKDKE